MFPRGMRAPGSPCGLAHGVVGQGKKVAARPLRDRGRRATASTSRRLIRQQQAARSGGPKPSRRAPAQAAFLPATTDAPAGGPARNDEKPVLHRVIEREGPIPGAIGRSRTPRRGGLEQQHHGHEVRPDFVTAERGEASSINEAISASGALNRPRRSSGGMTASTASNFWTASMRR